MDDGAAGWALRVAFAALCGHALLAPFLGCDSNSMYFSSFFKGPFESGFKKQVGIYQN
ncbi:MAG: hypothetical protein KIS77_13305 [Saprospiraceae bacterium]|nr:hypothetical protein [Saprospiraceae bacterium]